MRRSGVRLAAWAFIVGIGSGCSLLGAGQTAPKTLIAPPERPQSDASAVAPALELMRALPDGDPARQAELFQATKDAATLAPTTSNKLKFALALATPGHGGSDPVAAQRQLADLLATPETLLPVERLLAMVQLHEVDQRLVLQAESKQLREDAERESHDKLAATNRRLAADADENARLRKALDEALAKLEAVTHIEKSITDRGSNGSHTP